MSRSSGENRPGRVVSCVLPTLEIQGPAIEIKFARVGVVEDVPVALKPDAAQVWLTGRGAGLDIARGRCGRGAQVDDVSFTTTFSRTYLPHGPLPLDRAWTPIPLRLPPTALSSIVTSLLVFTVMPAPVSSPVPAPRFRASPLPVTLLPVMCPLRLISYRMPQAAFPPILLSVMTTPSPARSIQTPTPEVV